jgi:hypothetical protein
MRRTARAAAGALLVVAFAALAARAAQAGVRLEVRSERSAAPAGTAREPEKPIRYVVWIEGQRLAAELLRRDGAPPRRRIVFRSGEDAVWLVDAKRRTYYQVDPKSAEAAASQVAGLRQGLEQGLEALSPEQREAVKDLLGELAAPSAEPLPEYRLRRTRETGRYAGIACARQDVLDGERRVGDVCLAPYGAPPLARAQVAAVPALGGFLRRTLAPLAREFPSLADLAPFTALESIDGFPLAVRSVEDDGATRETLVTKVEETPVDASLFELPQGFARSWVPPF